MHKPPPIKTPYSAGLGSQHITSKPGSGFALAPVHPLDDELDQLENDQGVTPYDNYEEFGDALWDMMGSGYECADINRENINFDPQLECMETLAEERGEENQIYFYHPDHLGSSSFITDASGDAHQHLQYLPFGESFISQRINWATRYTFSAKEKDEATGYSYFGARYYDSENSVWLSVDPLASGFPGISPYAYVYNSPTMFVDPWGLAATKYVDKKGNEIENVDDGKDQTVQVNREQYEQTKEDFQKGGGDLSNRKDAERFTKNYEQASNVSDDIVFEKERTERTNDVEFSMDVELDLTEEQQKLFSNILSMTEDEKRGYIIKQQQKQIDQLDKEKQQLYRELAKYKKRERVALRIMIRTGAFFIPNINVDIEPWLNENIPIEGPPLQ